MENDSLKRKAASGMLWGGLSNGAMQVMGALFGLVLMRLLSPSDYGKVAMLNIFAALACAIQESGFIPALCNRRNPTHEEYNAVFWFNLLASLSLYAMLWVAAPWIADFYGDPDLTGLARYLFLGFLLSGLGTVQRAYLFGHLMVRQANTCTLVSMLLSSVVGVVMAWHGFAYWGIVTQSVMYVLVVQLMSWHYSPWRPSMHIDLRPALGMLGFSSRLMLTNVFNILNNHAFSVLLGKCFDSHTAGVYTTARKWDDMASGTVNGMVSGVAQPTLAQVADDRGRYVNVFRKMLRFASFVSFPAMTGLALIAREFIILVGGEKWAESGTVLAMLCMHGAFVPISTLYSSLMVSRGRSDVNMGCTVGQSFVTWGGLIALYPYGLHAMVLYFVAASVAWLLVWQWWAKRLVGLRWRDALSDTLPFLAFSVVVMWGTWLATSGIRIPILLLSCRIGMAATLYCALTWLSGARIMRESVQYLLRRGRTE